MGVPFFMPVRGHEKRAGTIAADSSGNGRGPLFLFRTGEKKKGRRRPTLARAGPALPSAMRRLTSVFGMGTGMTASLWPPALKAVSRGLKRFATFEKAEPSESHFCEVKLK